MPLQTRHVYYTLKRRGNDRFHVFSKWNTSGVFAGTVMQIKTTLINDRLSVCCVSRNFPFQLFNIFYCLFCLYTNSLRLNNLRTAKAMTTELSGFVIYVKTIIFLLLYNLHGCTVKFGSRHLFALKQK